MNNVEALRYYGEVLPAMEDTPTKKHMREGTEAIETLQAENAALKAENENLLAAGKFTSFQADKYLKEVESLKEQVAQLEGVIGEHQLSLDTFKAGANNLSNQLSTLKSKAAALVDALEDMRSGWIYIQQTHGDLYGVGWERAQNKANAALAAFKGEK